MGIRRPFSRRRLLVGSAVATAFPRVARAAAPSARVARQVREHTIVDLGGFGRAWAINDDGQAVGLSGSTAALWDQRQWRDLGTWPGDVSSEAFAINASGESVGVSWSTTYQPRAVLWTQGQIVDLGALAGGAESMAVAINDAGQAAGWSNAQDGTYRAVVWEVGQGGMLDLGTLLPGAFRGEATGINDSGVVAGWAEASDGTQHAVRIDGGSVVDLGSPGRTFGVNANGQVVGIVTASDGADRAVVWQADGSAVDLGTLPGGAWSWAMALNDTGQVVGTGELDGSELAVLWAGGQARALASLPDIDPAINGTSAYGINDAGQIVGESGGRPVLWEPAL